MTPRRLAILAVLAIVAAAIAGALTMNQPPPASAPLSAGELMFPGLVERLQTAAKVEITGKDGTLVLIREGAIWGLADRAGYPAQQQRVREMFTGLTELRLMEPRTADPARLAALNLDEPGPASTALRLVVRDAAGAEIAALVAGRRRVRMAGNVPEALYVRRPGESQAWLAEGSLRLDDERNLWIDRDLLDIKRQRVAAVAFHQGESTIQLSRATPGAERLALQDPPEGFRPDPTKLEDAASTLEWLTLEDVAPAVEMVGSSEVGSATWILYDGTRITAHVVSKDGVRWTAFDLAWTAPATPPPEGEGQLDPEAAKAAAETAARRLSGWYYKLPDWKLAAFLTTLETLRASEPPPAAPAAPPAGPGAPAGSGGGN